jgi:hypothetical protein
MQWLQVYCSNMQKTTCYIFSYKYNQKLGNCDEDGSTESDAFLLMSKDALIFL